MSDVFLPLRSNAAWFATEDTHKQLVRRFKNLLLFTDTVTVEDGRYQASFTATGSFDRHVPPQMVPDRTRIDYHTPGTEFVVRAAPSGTQDFQPIVSGALEASYTADFWPVLHEAGLTEADCIRWADFDLTDKGKETVRRAVHIARNDPSINNGLPQNQFLRSKIIESVYRDAMLAGGLDMPLFVDVHAASVVQRGNELIASAWQPDARAVLERAWLDLGLPDAGEESWDVVLSARESAAGADLRRTLDRLSGLAVNALTGEIDVQQWHEEARRLLVAELVAELLKRRPGVMEAGVNLGLNLVPYLGTGIGTLKDVADLVREHRSWVALLPGLRRSPQIAVKQ